MNILFFMLHPGYVRNYESTLRLLASRGHSIHLAFSQPPKQTEDQLPEQLASSYATVTYGIAPRRNDDLWGTLAPIIRGLHDCARYVHPRYKSAPELRQRLVDKVEAYFTRVPAVRYLLGPLVRGMDRVHSGWFSHLLLRCFQTLELGVPTNRRIDDFITDHAPDVVLVTPLVNVASIQVEYVKSARRLGIPTGVCVASWDNLTNKGLIRIEPDSIILWNEIQKREAVEMHGMPADKIVITGAQRFDEWFEQQPSLPRTDFLRRAGLPVDRPYVLYLCSSPFIAPDEVSFVAEWIQELRTHGTAAVREASILIRPHPQNAGQWRDADFSRFERVSIWPRQGANPVSTTSRADFFDSIYYSAAVMGINTSAQIEACIIGRPVLTLLAPQFAGTQEGTLHFHYLLYENGGPLRVAHSYAEHLQQLAAAMDGLADDQAHYRRFVESFVRPHGLATACTPLVADAIEHLGHAGRREPVRPPWWSHGLRLMLLPAAYGTNAIRTRRKIAARAVRRSRSSDRVQGNQPTVSATRSARPGLTRRVVRRAVRLAVARPTVRAIGRRVVAPVLAEATGATSPRAVLNPPGTVEMQATKAHLVTLSRSTHPIVVGPWLSEVGFELLYWIPFLNWVQTWRPLDRQRLVAVSRGGCAPWYRGLTDHYLDVLDWYSVDEFRTLNEQRVQAQGRGLKHWTVSAFDEQIIDRVKRELGVSKVELLHPSLMYHFYSPYWRKQASIRHLEKHVRYAAFEPLERGLVDLQLPDDYVAVKFYFSNAFPDTHENRAFITQLLADLSARTNVVLLTTGLRVDDHADYSAPLRERIYTIEDHIVPGKNLELQTRIVANARAFIGTYGGFSYLAPHYGVDSIAIYSNPEAFLPHHVDVARRAFTSLGRGAFLCLDRNELRSLQLILGYPDTARFQQPDGSRHRVEALGDD